MLRSSVRQLNDLVQVKIHRLTVDTQALADAGTGYDLCLRAEESQALVGGEAVLGASSSLLGSGRGAEEGLLHQSDLDYLERLGGELRDPLGSTNEVRGSRKEGGEGRAGGGFLF